MKNHKMKGKAFKRAFETKDSYRYEGDIPLLHSKLEFVTPEMAERYISLNGDNRPVNWKKVNELAKVIKANKYKITGQGIIFDENGRLLTGQKRLLAIKLAQRGVWLYVTRGNPRESREVIDRIETLSASDIAAMRTSRKENPFKVVEKQIARGLCYLMGVKPTLDNMANILTSNSENTIVIADAMEHIKKEKQVLFILCAICYLSKNKDEIVKLLSKTPMFADKLIQKVLPKIAPEPFEKCWGKGLIFKNTLQTAVEIVNSEIN